MSGADDELLFGWEDTPGIVSVRAQGDGSVTVWRRSASTGALCVERAQYRPWCLLAQRDPWPSFVEVRELAGAGQLRWYVAADDTASLERAVLGAAAARRGRRSSQLRDLGTEEVLVRPPEEQYLVQSGRTHFKGLGFDDLRRLQFDLETTGLDPTRDRIFLVALGGPQGEREILEADGPGDEAEAALIRSLVERIRELDPDVIENHNLHGFDLPFLVERATRLRVPLSLGREGPSGLETRPAARGSSRGQTKRRFRYSIIGRECIDTMDAVLRHDFAARDLPGHGLKAVARHFGLSGPDRELVPGARVHEVYRKDPERVRRYALDDVSEAAGLARLLGGAAFSLARMVPRRYERLADAGAATGVIDPLLVRAYLRAGRALPLHDAGDGTPHTGAALHLFASGAAERIVKADVASLYPSLMRQYSIGPARDELGALLGLVDRLVSLRLAAKARAKLAPPHSTERFGDEALSAAMKLVVNSAYGYLGAAALTRFSDVHAANEVTRRGRELLALLCSELAVRGVTLLEADTDGVYFSVPPTFSEADERRVVSEVDALLPEKVQLEFEGRYRAMLSHEPKNYALLGYDDHITLRGVAFRSSRSAPFGEKFLERALERLLTGDVSGLREVYAEFVLALTRRQLPTRDVASRVRLTKTADEYLATRASRRDPSYEAPLNAGWTRWERGTRLQVYRAEGGRAALLLEPEAGQADVRDYDVRHYVTMLKNNFASRLMSALDPEVYASVFQDPLQPSLFQAQLALARPRLIVFDSVLSNLNAEHFNDSRDD